ncbi:MOSC domain-containing protein [Roseovarius nanhaiticus]|uniref:MOSC domain-containing protein n=1 Tax=Roseovarius nanhaiticus TaxID=573024 RepID=UPI00249026A8|nr:MOSC domain-containing protein [Roseovarius nanhaiticus]
MPALKLTPYKCRITWLGLVPEERPDIRSAPVDDVELTYAGVQGEMHSGLTRPACVRVKEQFARGTEIANTRQLSIVSAEELAEIAARMGLAVIDPAWLGASMVVEGVPDFSHLPPSARLQGPDGASLVIDMQNRPCLFPAREIDKDHPGRGPKFKAAAKGRRGVTAWVEREGRMAVGDALRLFIPDQRAWRPGK